MPAPFLATVTILSAAQPKSGGGSTVLAMITPLGGPHAGQGLPEAPEGTDPGYGHPIGGHPDQGLPWAPGRPDNGVPVPPETWPAQPPPPLPPHLEDQVIVAIHRPGVTEWTVKAYPVPTPKG
jgi:hypothetical protein